MQRRQSIRPWNRPARWAAWVLCFGSTLSQAQIAAVPCGTSTLDFSSASAHGGRGSIHMPGAAGIGQVNPGAVGEWWQAVTPNAARAGWWPSQGGDHSSMGQAPRDGYFLLFDIIANGSRAVMYSNQLTNLTIGQEYTVSLWLASAYHVNSPRMTVELLDAAGAVAQQASPVLANVTDDDAPDLPWQQVSFSFKATGASQGIRLREALNTSGLGADLALDDISLSHRCAVQPPVPSGAGPAPVPALDGAGLLLAGTAMGALGAFFARRRPREGRCD